ncbi:MAG: hypothetical protein FJ399_11125 [Verrucomicrobia bacterium]|nr:hypothetical protein [Verrucomicrobiota bacterium]
MIVASLVFFSLSALAQPVTAAPAPIDPETEAIVHAPPKVRLTFGLDRVAPLRYGPFADIPLWQCLSSLIHEANASGWSLGEAVGCR